MAHLQRAYLSLLRKLASGQWAPGQRIPSLRQLAGQQRMSTKPLASAVHTAARQGLLQLSDRSRAVVLPEAAEQARQMLAQMAGGRRLKRVAVLIPEEFFPMGKSVSFTELAQTICQEAAHRGLDAQPVAIPEKDQTAFARRAAAHYDAAIVVYGKPETLTTLFALHDLSMPMVLFDRQIPGLDVPSVITDTHSAAVRIARILVQLGHRNLCFVATQTVEFMSAQPTSTAGWLNTLQETGVLETCSMPLVYYRQGTFLMTLDRILRLQPPVTAIVLSVSALVGAMVDAPRFHQLKIPGQLSMATLRTVQNTMRPPTFPPITAFDVDLKRVGELLIQSIESSLAGARPPLCIRMPLDIVLTESIGPPPKETAETAPWPARAEAQP